MSNLKMLRMGMNLTLNQMSNLTGIKISTLGGYERERRRLLGARFSNLIKMCLVVNCGITDIIEDDDVRNRFMMVCDNPRRLIVCDRGRIHELRIRSKKSQEECAEMMGTYQANYSAMEKRKAENMKFENVLKLCEVFDCSPLDLIDNDVMRSALRRVI